MRLTRAVSLLMAILLAATLSQALISPSQASVAPAAHQALMKPKHDLKARGTEIGNTNHFVAYGTITTYPKVFLFRKIGTGGYSLYRKIKVDNKGRFRTRIFQYKNVRTCFKVGAPETSTYAVTVKSVGCIFSA
jgi:hypothetical protein